MLNETAVVVGQEIVKASFAESAKGMVKAHPVVAGVAATVAAVAVTYGSYKLISNWRAKRAAKASEENAARAARFEEAAEKMFDEAVAASK